MTVIMKKFFKSTALVAVLGGILFVGGMQIAEAATVHRSVVRHFPILSHQITAPVSSFTPDGIWYCSGAFFGRLPRTSYIRTQWAADVRFSGNIPRGACVIGGAPHPN